ncbi:MAG: methyltransferase domain-containing protein [Lachnospiraceae bacterium]|nr:methyltransferase domain-containing protein [Lachnospiraceae bacterium]
MSLAMGLCNKVKSGYYIVLSEKKKKLFTEEKSDTYQYMDEIFCSNRKAFDAVVRNNPCKTDEYWSLQKSYSVKKYFPQTFAAARKLIFDNFLTLYQDRRPVLMDIGCASGEWTMMVAPKCSRIDGFEFSQNMVNTASVEAQKLGAGNAHFYRTDAATMHLDGKYDGAMILAVLMYFDDIDVIYQILKRIYDHLEPGAYLCTRDTLNNENKDLILMYNRSSGYSAFYWNKKLYYEQFEKVGFVMKKEMLLDEVTSRRMNFIHVGNIWQKPEN